MSEEAKGKGVLQGHHYEQGALKDRARTPKTSQMYLYRYSIIQNRRLR